MTKPIDAIYELLSRDQPLTEEQVDAMTEDLGKTLKSALASPKDNRALRMSSVGTPCWRQLWFRRNKPECLEPLPPHTKLMFTIGHIAEAVVLSLLKAAGKNNVTGEQDVMELHGVRGHRDVVIDGVTYDVKTANTRSIHKFKNHELETNDPFGYIDQLSLYVAADTSGEVDKTKGRFLVFDKELGHLIEDEYPVRNKDYKKQIAEMQLMLVQAEPPSRPFGDEADGKSGNRVIPLNCRYCDAKQECWKDANGGRGLLKYIYSNGPRWFTRVVREPDVPKG